MKKSGIVIGLILAFVASFVLVGCAPKVEPKMTSLAEKKKEEAGPERTLEEKMKDLKIEDVKVGKGKEIENGMAVLVHYTGTLDDGTVFDSNQAPDEPFSFIIGTGGVIDGWEAGLIGMKEGGIRKLTVPSDMGYGYEGNPRGGIPSNATLHFEIELVETFELIR